MHFKKRKNAQINGLWRIFKVYRMRWIWARLLISTKTFSQFRPIKKVNSTIKRRDHFLNVLQADATVTFSKNVDSEKLTIHLFN